MRFSMLSACALKPCRSRRKKSFAHSKKRLATMTRSLLLHNPKSKIQNKIMIRFDYQEPTTLKKAFSLLEKHGDDARVIAGGTSLLIMMRQRLLMPKVVISLTRIPKFDRITYKPNDGLRIGAGARHRDIELSPPVKKHYPLLHETFRKVAQPRIRNMGTIGGDVAAG